jgi:hypothetical protein
MAGPIITVEHQYQLHFQGLIRQGDSWLVMFDYLREGDKKGEGRIRVNADRTAIFQGAEVGSAPAPWAAGRDALVTLTESLLTVLGEAGKLNP